MIYLILLSIILACIAAYFWKEMRYQKKEANHYEVIYKEAKDAWASQSNSIREKALECGYLDKANKHLEKELKGLKKRLKDARITI